MDIDLRDFDQQLDQMMHKCHEGHKKFIREITTESMNLIKEIISSGYNSMGWEPASESWNQYRKMYSHVYGTQMNLQGHYWKGDLLEGIGFGDSDLENAEEISREILSKSGHSAKQEYGGKFHVELPMLRDPATGRLIHPGFAGFIHIPARPFFRPGIDQTLLNHRMQWKDWWWEGYHR